jgi:hypothetical protein
LQFLERMANGVTVDKGLAALWSRDGLLKRGIRRPLRNCDNRTYAEDYKEKKQGAHKSLPDWMDMTDGSGSKRLSCRRF